MLVDAEKLKQLRKQSGWTQEQFAELCGLSVRTIQRVEKGTIASMETTNALAAVLEVERVEILAKGGATPATLELPLTKVLIIACLTFFLGISVGVFLIG